MMPTRVNRQETHDPGASAPGATCHARPARPHLPPELDGDGKQPQSDAPQSAASGLCATCNHTHVCAYAAGAQRRALFCELFDDFVAAPLAGVTSAAVQAVGGNAAKAGARASPSKGLCANCDLSGTCALPRPEGGVWHCEEYR